MTGDAIADGESHRLSRQDRALPSAAQWDHWHSTCYPRVVTHKEADLFYRHLSPRPGTAAVDLGCGNGQWTRQLARWGLRVRGYDYSQEALRQARAATTGHNPGYASWDIAGSPAPADMPTGTLDLATCRDALPYFHHPELLTQIARWLRPTGAFYALTNLTPQHAKRRPREFHRGLTLRELHTVGSNWPHRLVYRLSPQRYAVILRLQ